MIRTDELHQNPPYACCATMGENQRPAQETR